MKQAAIDRELDGLREELIEDVREAWMLDDRWEPWRPDPEDYERVYDWTTKDLASRLRREDHNSLVRAYIRRVRALDAIRRMAARAVAR